MARNAFAINCIFYKYKNITMLYNHLALQLSTFYKNELMFSCFCLCRYPNVPLKERVKTAQNWYHGFCKKWTLLKWKTKYVNHLLLLGKASYIFLGNTETFSLIVFPCSAPDVRVSVFFHI